MSKKTDETKKGQTGETREDRLKAALRANLRRRKIAARKSQSSDTGKD